MRRKFFLMGAPAMIALMTIIVYGSFERVDSENPLSCLKRVQGYVYCDTTHTYPCDGAYVTFVDIWEHGHSYNDYANSQGYFDLGYIACDDYLATVTCGDDCLYCYYYSAQLNECAINGSCAGFEEASNCVIYVHANPDVCPGSK